MLLYFFTLRLLGYRIFRWLFNFTIFWLFNFTKFWWYKVTYYNGARRPPSYYCLQYSYLWEGAIKASDIIVGRGSPRPVLHVITFAC